MSKKKNSVDYKFKFNIVSTTIRFL